tara:strand:+ start:2663 stop:4033 length:1371 start_codon:yes stop_codon:yes gene_type:complete
MLLMNKFKGFSIEEWRLIKSTISTNEKVNGTNHINIIEKLRRFCSFHGRKLADISIKRFPDDAIFQLDNIIDVLLSKSISSQYNNHLTDNIPIDPANLNAALYCLDALKTLGSKKVKYYSSKIKAISMELEEFLLIRFESFKKSNNLKKQELVEGIEGSINNRSIQKEKCSIIIFSPNAYSLYTISVIALCVKLDIPIKAIIVRRFSLLRFKQEFKRDGIKLIKKIYRKLILKADENSDKIDISMKQIKNILCPKYDDIYKYALNEKISISKVYDFDESNDFLIKNNADIGLFTGGGILSEHILNCFSKGIINVHMGILPFYKGMDVVQSAIMESRNDLLGLTSHLMEPGVDTGPILKTYQVNPTEYSTLGELRNEIGLIMPFLLIESCLALLNKSFIPIKQEQRGRQYYFLHSRSIDILNNLIKKNRNTGQDTQVKNDIIKMLNLFNFDIPNKKD